MPLKDSFVTPYAPVRLRAQWARVVDNGKKAYAAAGPWIPGSFHMESSGPLKAALSFNDRNGHHWQGTLTAEPVAADAHQIVLRVVTARAD